MQSSPGTLKNKKRIPVWWIILVYLIYCKVNGFRGMLLIIWDLKQVRIQELTTASLKFTIAKQKYTTKANCQIHTKTRGYSHLKIKMKRLFCRRIRDKKEKYKEGRSCLSKTNLNNNIRVLQIKDIP